MPACAGMTASGTGGQLRLWLGIAVVTDISLGGWVASNYGQAKNLLIILASLAIVILTGTIAIFNRKIEAAIERLGDFCGYHLCYLHRRIALLHALRKNAYWQNVHVASLVRARAKSGCPLWDKRAEGSMKTNRKRKFFDPNILRKGQMLQQHIEYTNEISTSPPFFSLIEFNLSGLCNRKCVFCPRIDPKVFPDINEHIPVKLYEKIMKELADGGYDGVILYSAFGEPLLYKRIELLIELSKKYCPKVRVETVTDGDFVTPTKLRTLFSSGLDTLLISLYDGPHQVDIFEGMMTEVGLSDAQVILRKRWLPPEEHYGITLSNRAGMIEMSEVGIGKLEEPLKRRCFYPFYQILVDYDGAVLLCPHDWGKKLIAGNLSHQTIQEVWNSKVMRQVRMSLANADRNFAPCSVCDVDGTLMGQKSFDRWMNYYQRR